MGVVVVEEDGSRMSYWETVRSVEEARMVFPACDTTRSKKGFVEAVLEICD